MSNTQYRWGIIGLGLVWASAIVLGVWPDVPSESNRQISRFLIAGGLSALIWWLALAVTNRFEQSERGASDRTAVWMILGIAAIVRVIVLIVAPDSTARALCSSSALAKSTCRSCFSMMLAGGCTS